MTGMLHVCESCVHASRSSKVWDNFDLQPLFPGVYHTKISAIWNRAGIVNELLVAVNNMAVNNIDKTIKLRYSMNRIQ